MGGEVILCCCPANILLLLVDVNLWVEATTRTPSQTTPFSFHCNRLLLYTYLVEDDALTEIYIYTWRKGVYVCVPPPRDTPYLKITSRIIIFFVCSTSVISKRDNITTIIWCECTPYFFFITSANKYIAALNTHWNFCYYTELSLFITRNSKHTICLV